MRIDFNDSIGKFIVSTDIHGTDLENARNIPNRKYDKTSGLWIAGPTRANVAYLGRWDIFMSARAKAACDEIVKGAVIRKGTPPADFHFKTDPYPHQLEPFLRSIDLDEYALFMDPGTGKSKVLIDDSVAAFLSRKINAVLVVCPNSIKSNWEDEIRTHGAGEHKVFIYDPSKKAAAEKFIKESGDGALKWFIIAVESFSQGTAWSIAEKFLYINMASVCVDESSRIKTHNTTRTKKILSLTKYAKRRRIATGTPFSKGIHQTWSQYEFLNPNILDMGYFAFRNHFCIMGGFKGKQIIGNMNVDQFIDLVAPYTYRASKSECLKLPPKVYQIRTVAPTPQQKKLYEDLKNEGSAGTDNGFVTYTNTLVRDLRLQQISGGFVALEKIDLEPVDITDVEGYIQRMADKAPCTPIEGKNPKIEELLEVCDEIPGKIIIWSRFKPEINAIVEALRKEYGHGAVVEFHGDVSDDDRTLARRRFQTDPECLYFVGQVSTGGIGITLTAAPTMIYFGNAWSLEDRIQSEDRFHRIGQTAESVTIIDLVMEGNWVDRKILKALKEGRSYTEVVMDQIHEATSGHRQATIPA